MKLKKYKFYTARLYYTRGWRIKPCRVKKSTRAILNTRGWRGHCRPASFFHEMGLLDGCHHAFFPRVGSEKTSPSCSFFHGMGPKILEILKFRPLKFSFINTNVYLKKWPVVLRKKNTYHISLKVKNHLKIIFVFFMNFKDKKKYLI